MDVAVSAQVMKLAGMSQACTSAGEPVQGMHDGPGSPEAQQDDHQSWKRQKLSSDQSLHAHAGALVLEYTGRQPRLHAMTAAKAGCVRGRQASCPYQGLPSGLC
jgi:hypothetical protein